MRGTFLAVLAVLSSLGCQKTITLTLRTTELSGDDIVPDVDGCVVRPDIGVCGTTDANGEVVFEGVPANEPLVFSFDGANHYPMLGMRRPESEDLAMDFKLPGLDIIPLFFAVVGENIDDTAGHIFFASLVGGDSEDGRDEVQVELLPDAGAGPYYLTVDGIPNTNLTATTAFGTGAYANVPPGDYEMEFTHPTLPCEERWTWRGDVGYTLEVRAERLTYVAVNCVETAAP